MVRPTSDGLVGYILGVVSAGVLVWGAGYILPQSKAQSQQVKQVPWQEIARTLGQDTTLTRILREHPEEFCTRRMLSLLTPQANDLVEAYDIGNGYWEHGTTGKRKAVSPMRLVMVAEKYAENRVITSDLIRRAYEEETEGWVQNKIPEK